MFCSVTAQALDYSLLCPCAKAILTDYLHCIASSGSVEPYERILDTDTMSASNLTSPIVLLELIIRLFFLGGLQRLKR